MLFRIALLIFWQPARWRPSTAENCRHLATARRRERMLIRRAMESDA